MSGHATIPAAALPWITVEQMVEVDRIMIDDLGITLARMMENAGRALSMLTLARLDGAAPTVTLLAGGGGNGGGGLAAARHLANAGVDVDVRIAVPPERLSRAAAEQEAILEQMGVVTRGPAGRTITSTLVLDALLGYSADGPPRGAVAELIGLAGGRRTISLDVPSGLELVTGTEHDLHVMAEATLTLAAPKGALADSALVGELFLGDISVPATVWERLGVVPVPPFSQGPVVRIDDANGR